MSEQMRNALRTIAELPVPEQDNMIAANMRAIAIESIAIDASEIGDFGGKAVNQRALILSEHDTEFLLELSRKTLADVKLSMVKLRELGEPEPDPGQWWAVVTRALYIAATKTYSFDDWVSLTDADRERAFNSLPNMLDGFLKNWGWLHFAQAIEDICREKNSTPKEPK